MLKAIGYIEKVRFFSEKTYFTSFVRNMLRPTIYYKYHATLEQINSLIDVWTIFNVKIVITNDIKKDIYKYIFCFFIET